MRERPWLTKDFAENTLAEVIAEAEKIGLALIPIKREVKISNSYHTFGSFRCNPDGTGAVTISRIHATPESLRETIAHEVCHGVVCASAHNAVWKNAAHVMNEAYGYRITRTKNHSDAGDDYYNHLRYFVRCKKCGYIMGRMRISKIIKSPEKFYHRRCKGNFEHITKEEALKLIAVQNETPTA